MPILHSQNQSLNILAGSNYSKEEELRDYLCQSPNLLIHENEYSASYVTKEFRLLSAGQLDILLIDSNGVPIVVECKLYKNEESRREILAQIFDYVSALSLLTIDELDYQLTGALSSTIKIIADGDEKKFDTIWSICATNLRAGNIRVILAIDEARDDLIRIVRFVNDHSDLDVRLTTIKKYENSEVGLILVPSFVVYGASESFSIKSKSKPRVARKEFESIISAYKNIYKSEEFLIGNSASNHRKIIKETWDANVHYEFLDRFNGPTIELHLENKKYASIFSKIEDVVRSYENDFLDCNIKYDPKWCGVGRIILELKGEDPEPEKYAEVMSRFIGLTNKGIEIIITDVEKSVITSRSRPTAETV
ncbi:MAG: hypothetical protein KKB34_05030 [Bacteroidetes bacterium]|nr:hypothetical protein [Bacteroidota bacterium]